MRFNHAEINIENTVVIKWFAFIIVVILTSVEEQLLKSYTQFIDSEFYNVYSYSSVINDINLN